MYIRKILLATVLLGLVFMGGFAYFVHQTFFASNTAFNNAEAHVYIRTGVGFDAVLAEVSPLLKDLSSFKTVAEKKGYVSNIKPGHYILKKGMDNNEIITALRSLNIPINVKFNNQERLEDLAGHISRQIEADSLELLKAMRDPVFLEKAGLTQENALSLYIPNTYEFYWNSSAETFRDRMLEENKVFWNQKRHTKAESLGLTKEEVMALAAIVQKETAMVGERPKVAGVYINRLEAGMLLQADPTVIYAKKKLDNDFDQIIKRVLYSDLETVSPYNTYKHSGLPPGPITMPDISSIDAVLNYEKHGYYYFVADVSNFGYHKFAESLTKHNANKREYIRWLEAQTGA